MNTKEKEKLMEACRKHQIAFEVNTNNQIIFMCSEVPTSKIKRAIAQAVPEDYKFDFIITPKPATQAGLQVLLQSIGFYGLLTVGKGNLILENKQLNVPKEHPFWETMRQLLYKDKYFKSWNVTLGTVNMTYDRKISETLENRKGRDHIITLDEITDLNIGLANCNTIDDILKELGCDS